MTLSFSYTDILLTEESVNVSVLQGNTFSAKNVISNKLCHKFLPDGNRKLGIVF